MDDIMTPEDRVKLPWRKELAYQIAMAISPENHMDAPRRSYLEQAWKLLPKIEALIERRAALDRDAVIEACAMAAQELRHPHGRSAETVEWCHGTADAAAAIRALKVQP